MKTNNLELVMLTNEELINIDGGSFWHDLAYAIGYTAHAIYEIGRAGGEYQQSLPSSLKK